MTEMTYNEAIAIINHHILWLDKNKRRCRSALTAVIHNAEDFADLYDVSAAASGFLVGRAWGIREERERRHASKPARIIDTIMSADETFDLSPKGRKAYRRAMDAVMRIHGTSDALDTAVYEVEAAAYRQGFAAAMQLLKECGVQP